MDNVLLEKQLIEKFKIEFYDKLGYYPIVITDREITENKKLMSLYELECLFENILPSLYGKKMTIGSKNRNRPIVELRAIYVFLARCMGYRLIDIATYMQKHHASIIHYEDLFANLMSTSEEFRILFEKVYTHVKQNHESHDELSTMVYFNKVWNKSKSIILSGLLQVED